MIKYPVETYHSGSDLADQDGHIATAESQHFAEEIRDTLNEVARLRATVEELTQGLRPFANITDYPDLLREICDNTPGLHAIERDSLACAFAAARRLVSSKGGARD